MLKTHHSLLRLLCVLPILILGMLLCHPLLSPAALAAGLLAQGLSLGRKSVGKTMRFGLPLILLMGGLNCVFSGLGDTTFLYLNDFPLTLESLVYGLCAGCMALEMAVWLMLLSVSLGRAGLFSLFGGVLPGITMILSMLFRFLPLYRRRMKSRVETQQTLGLNVENGTLLQRIKTGAALLSSQLSASLEQSITTADSMTARGYGLGGRVTRWPKEAFHPRDGVLLALLTLLSAGAFLGYGMGGLSCRFYPRIEESFSGGWFILGALCYGGLLLLPSLAMLFERTRERILRRRWEAVWKKETGARRREYEPIGSKKSILYLP